MDDYECEVFAKFVPSTGEVHYQMLHSDISYGDEDDIRYPTIGYSDPVEYREDPYLGQNGPGVTVWVLATAPTVAALASMIKTFIMRDKGRKVLLHWSDESRQLKLTGSFSVEEIEALIRAQNAEPDPNGVSTDEEKR